MAKILVADDNSNVQKTVALALAELGVEVVSVNNGEAAVRKLADFSPDLILADIFMPVRNGYEVCEFVKKDPRFSRVPVVLLVGAFDPLDEREAQRVGADGILKKPFVPPDPLITMIKTLLDRTLGDHLVSVAAPSPSVVVQAKSGGHAIAEERAPEPEAPEESSSQEFPTPVERVAFGNGEHPVAFGTLLDTTAHNSSTPKTAEIEPVDDEQILTSSRDANLGDPIFWKNDAHEPGPEAEALEETPAEIASSIPEVRPWKKDEESIPLREPDLSSPPDEPLELVREEQEETPSGLVDPVSILQDPAALATLNVDSHKPEDLSENPIEWMASAPPLHSDEAAEVPLALDEPIPAAVEAIQSVESSDHVPELVQELPPEPAKPSVPVSIPVIAHVDVPVVQKTPVPAIPAPPTPKPPAVVPPPVHVALSPEAQRATDTARSIPKQNWSDLTASLMPSVVETVSQMKKSDFAPATPAPTAATGSTPASPANPAQAPNSDQALVEAVVQRVLDKMRPQVVDIITKEFLRPIVQALVHREIDKH